VEVEARERGQEVGGQLQRGWLTERAQRHGAREAQPREEQRGRLGDVGLSSGRRWLAARRSAVRGVARGAASGEAARAGWRASGVVARRSALGGGGRARSVLGLAAGGGCEHWWEAGKEIGRETCGVGI
jgi:hypothetical protein